MLRPSLESLAEDLQETASAAILDGSDAVYLARVCRRKSMMYDIAVGTRIPAYCTALGRVLLAQLSQEDRQARLSASKLEKRTPYTVTNPDKLNQSIEDVRRMGYALMDQELELGLRSLAIPIFDTMGKCICAVNVALPTARMSLPEMLDVVLPKLTDAANKATYLKI